MIVGARKTSDTAADSAAQATGANVFTAVSAVLWAIGPSGRKPANRAHVH
jgi:hypothetical protein